MMPKRDACGMGNSDIQRICPVFHCSPVLRDPTGGLVIFQGTVSKGDFRNVEGTERGRLPRDDHISLTDVLRASPDNP